MADNVRKEYSALEDAIGKLVSDVKSEQLSEEDHDSSARTVYIRTHNGPDPDALSSSIALSTILHLENIDSDIFFHRESPFYQNQAMQNLLDLKTNSNITRLGTLAKKLGASDLEKRLSSYKHAVLVDTSRIPADSPDYKFITPELVIDHHNKNGAKKNIYTINPKTGANISFLITYLAEKGVSLQEQEDKNLRITSYYGIETDTADFMPELMTETDYEAKEILEHVMTDEERTILEKVRRPTIDRTVKRSYGKALAFHEIYLGDKLVVYCVPGIMSDSAIAPYIADKLFREEQLGKAVIVYGLSDNTEDDSRYLELVASGRSLDSTINMPEVFEETFYTKGSEGRREQFSGGTSIAQTGFSKAGATVPMPELEDYAKDDLEGMWPTLQKKYADRIKNKFVISDATNE